MARASCPPLDHLRRGHVADPTQLRLGSAVTTLKNTIDKLVTEYGVAELPGRSLRERARSLIAIAHPDSRDVLTREARELGYL